MRDHDITHMEQWSQESQNDTLGSFPKSSCFCLDGKITARSEFPVAGGGSSDIWKGSLGTRTVAIKVIRHFSSTGAQIQRTKLIKRLWREYLTWSCISHPNIIACCGYTYDFTPGGDLPALISTWMPNGDVNSYIRTHPGVDRFKLILGIADGLSYLHNRDPVIVHGDLRAGNILVSKIGVPHLTDFGISKILDDTLGMTTSSDPAGAMRWMAPELFSGGKSSVSSDVWAYGMTLLEIFSGARPYDKLSELMVFGQIIKGEMPSRPATVTDTLWAIFQECCKLHPEHRPSMHAVIRILTKFLALDASVSTVYRDSAISTSRHSSNNGLVGAFAHADVPPRPPYSPSPPPASCLSELASDVSYFHSFRDQKPDDNESSPTLGKALEKAPFVCLMAGCGRTFTRSFNLKAHMRSHNEERPFKCKWPRCEKAFVRQHDCKRHEAVHLDIRPHTCGACGKTFARTDALNRHRKLRSHDEENVFKCEWPGCKKEFVQQNDLDLHKALHLKTPPCEGSGCQKMVFGADALNMNCGVGHGVAAPLHPNNTIKTNSNNDSCGLSDLQQPDSVTRIIM